MMVTSQSSEVKHRCMNVLHTVLDSDVAVSGGGFFLITKEHVMAVGVFVFGMSNQIRALSERLFVGGESPDNLLLVALSDSRTQGDMDKLVTYDTFKQHLTEAMQNLTSALAN